MNILSHFLPKGTWTEYRISWFMNDAPEYAKYSPPLNGIYHLWACCAQFPPPQEFTHTEWVDYIFSLSGIQVPERYIQVQVVGGDLNPIRKISSVGKSSIRKKRMEARIRKKDPLFAEEFIEKAIQAKPEYFDPDFIENEDKEFEERMEKWDKDEMQRFINNSILREDL